jgi:hypothetical protein
MYGFRGRRGPPRWRGPCFPRYPVSRHYGKSSRRRLDRALLTRQKAFLNRRQDDLLDGRFEPVFPRAPAGLYCSIDESNPVARYVRAQPYSVVTSTPVSRARSAITRRGGRARSSTGLIQIQARASAQSRSSRSARSGRGTGGSASEIARKPAIGSRSRSPVSTSRATTVRRLRRASPAPVAYARRR